MLLPLILIAISVHSSTSLGDESRSCITSITQADCERYSVLVSSESGCPRCETGVEQCQECDDTSPCAPGLKCELLEQDGEKYCTYDKSTCHHLHHLPQQIQWIPDCYPTGTFVAKQCRGDKVSGRCFCFDEAGHQIFGWDWRVNEDEMTCACSRRRAQLEAEGHLDVTLHCAQNGNYEELQCERDVCWCADPATGALAENTTMLPFSMWQALPCCKSVTFYFFTPHYTVPRVNITKAAAASNTDTSNSTTIKQQQPCGPGPLHKWLRYYIFSS